MTFHPSIMNRLLMLAFLLFTSTTLPAQIYVSIKGTDAAEGTKEKPLASIHMALRKAREWRRLHHPVANEGIHIYVDKGTYYFSEPLFIRPEDAGTVKSPTIIEALTKERPVFSGGRVIRGWRKISGVIQHLPSRSRGMVWVADAPDEDDDFDFRQLWINNKKAIRARELNGNSMARILSWDRQNQSCWIPNSYSDIKNAKGMEMVIHQWWAIANLRVRSAKVVGDSVLLHFHQPESRVQSEHPWPAPWISKETGNSAFYLTNAIQFLDEPGEWFLDKTSRKIYYWPRKGEDLNTAVVVAPFLETLIKLQGTADHPVSNLYFKNLSFQHSSWLRPSRQGHVPHQIGMYMLDAYKLKEPGTPDKQMLENQAWVGRPAASVEISFAKGTSFEGCRFEHLASTGLDYGKGCHNNIIIGNLFKDIGGTAIMMGWFSDEPSEVHLPYNPKDEREVTDSNIISNNLINNVANEDWGCAAIAAGYVRNIVIENNDISELPYTGISIGWGWTRTESVMRNNLVARNKIYRFAGHLYDVAAIYTLSAQPGTVISENYIDSAYVAPYAHLPTHWFYLYTDEGSSFITLKDNWTPSEKFLQNANGPGNRWSNNGPLVNEAIKRKAGLQASYQYLLKEREAVFQAWSIAVEKPLIIELIASNKKLDIALLKSTMAKYKIDSNTLYQWQNHYVIFGKVQDVSVLQGKLQNLYPSVQVKVYYTPFYEFNRSRCTDTATAKEWQHILLSANLVTDPVLQQEYVDHHATQFEKWPQLSFGFCNARFQQLLLYRNGRQLMLVISIPKGESLEKLNPKTSENNPRVDQWNTLMKKYQEGLHGTKPGETWIFFKPI
jgi:hypothetical protein